MELRRHWEKRKHMTEQKKRREAFYSARLAQQRKQKPQTAKSPH